MELKKIVVSEKFNLFNEYWSPKIISVFNENYIKLAKLKGEFVWHHHEKEDEVFIVLKGVLQIQIREHPTVILNEGEVLVIPKGIEHLPIADKEVQVLLIEPKSTLNTGNIKNDEKTKEDLEFI